MGQKAHADHEQIKDVPGASEEGEAEGVELQQQLDHEDPKHNVIDYGKCRADPVRDILGRAKAQRHRVEDDDGQDRVLDQIAIQPIAKDGAVVVLGCL